MGYSGRYHATSLIAVFLALAIGILIGAEFGGDALTSTRKNLEASLVNNLQDARSKTDELNGRLGRSNEFADRVYPALTRERLKGKRLAIVALGGLPSEDTNAVEAALGPTGAKLVGVGVVREPVDLNGLAGDLAKTRFADVKRNPDSLTALGVGVGRQLVRGEPCPKSSAATSSHAPAATSVPSTASSSSATSRRTWARSSARLRPRSKAGC